MKRKGKGMKGMNVKNGIIASCFAAFAALAASGGQDNILASFSTTGPDRYADGSVVADGESYALVWTAPGATFAGVAVDGGAADPATGAVLFAAPLAKGGRCPEVVVEIERSVADRYADGSFSLVLLDTRRADGTPGGVASGVNGYGAAESFALSLAEQFQGERTASAPTEAAAVSAITDEVRSPVIKAIEVNGGKVRLTVARTSPLLRYAVSAGDAPDALAADPAAVADGDAGGDITIEVPAKGAGGFFSVGRAPLKR